MPRRSPGRLRAAIRSLDAGQRRSLLLMGGAVLALHLAGFLTLIAIVAPRHYGLGGTQTLTVGIGLAAYTLGLRHAFDADHIAAIDNATRKLMSEGKRPVSVGFWFSLGHSTIVFGLALLLSVGIKSLAAPVRSQGSALHEVAGSLGTLVSGSFLYLIAALNLVILIGIVRVFAAMRGAPCEEAELELRLRNRGLINRLFSRATGAISRPVQVYPVGALFGLGFDTATEVALLVLAGGAAGAGLPWYAILCLPILFAAGMSLMDSVEGAFMTLAYGWAFADPVRRVYYNITVTGLSVLVAFVIGTIELGGLMAEHLNLSGAFWSEWESIDLNALGFMITGLFAVTLLLAAAVWRLGRIGERWARE